MSENKIIAKNTVFLYIRMLVLLTVGLYTSRVTISVLGISDYGIYNVVGGVVLLFSFIDYALVSSTQRYLTYELGRGNCERVSLVFSTSINIHSLVSFITVLLSETIGLWFFYNKMNIPTDRFDAAFWVFQFSVLSCLIRIMTEPYNALIIANERMSAFAYMSLLDAFLKLLGVYFLTVSDSDRLLLYGMILFIISIINFVMYGKYCKAKFPEIKYRFVIEKFLTIEMTKFTSWNLVGNLAYVCYTQGINLLLNIFFNPVVNAARGISVQIQSVVSNFSCNIENAIKPQITKSYAKQDVNRAIALIFFSARLSFYVLLIIAIPIFVETTQILTIWLVEVPEYTVSFTRLTMLYLLSESLTNPLTTAALVTGNIKKYQLTVSLLCLSILPFSYISLLVISKPEIVFVVCLIFSFILQFVKLWIVGRLINISKKKYLDVVIIRCCVVSVLSISICFFLTNYILDEWWRIAIVFFVGGIAVLALVWFIGITKNEKLLVKSYYENFVTIFFRKEK